jgi:NAD(P)-dependent dehydrogenase (short-subunit alcohol dehydrogenase family)
MMEITKAIVITGASSGIGEAPAGSGRAPRFLGARRADRLESLAEEITKVGGVAAFRRLDVTDAADMRSFIDAARSEFGRVDVVVDNAGVMPLSPLEALKVDEWDRMIDVDVRGVLHGIAAAIAFAVAQPRRSTDRHRRPPGRRRPITPALRHPAVDFTESIAGPRTPCRSSAPSTFRSSGSPSPAPRRPSRAGVDTPGSSTRRSLSTCARFPPT